mmetsp:Transcript_53278/g.157612  ORF Transcript_53278/g.157612 Transcript_53278/m.157612 type:complete len:224 (+) Transcript_53278:466-1137(+)
MVGRQVAEAARRAALARSPVQKGEADALLARRRSDRNHPGLRRQRILLLLLLLLPLLLLLRRRHVLRRVALRQALQPERLRLLLRLQDARRHVTLLLMRLLLLLLRRRLLLQQLLLLPKALLLHLLLDRLLHLHLVQAHHAGILLPLRHNLGRQAVARAAAAAAHDLRATVGAVVRAVAWRTAVAATRRHPAVACHGVLDVRRDLVPLVVLEAVVDGVGVAGQ